jgi:hypothetical protein
LSCRRLACPYCGPRLTLSTVKAIELAAPRSSGVVTLPPDKTPTSYGALLGSFARVLGSVAESLRVGGSIWEYVWVVELSERLQPNVHFLQRGDGVTSLRFRRALAAAGGRGDLQPIRHLGRLSRYILKLPLAGLDLQDVDATAAMDLHLLLNGGRLIHASRRFFVDAKGVPLNGVRAARAEARRVGTRGPAPTPEQLVEWRAGWKLPPGTWGLGGHRGGAVGLETHLSRGRGGGTSLGAFRGFRAPTERT